MKSTNTNNRIYRVLWTGGLDSTYRMIELALQDVIVEPVYVVNNGRRSHNIELQAMKTMLELLRNKDRFRAEIGDIKIVNKEEITISSAIHEAYEELHKSYDIGSQYEWLAALSKTVDNLEICIEKAPEGRLHSRDAIVDGAGGIIFDSFDLPIFNVDEEEMLANIRNWDCEDVISHIWFCNHPLINDEGEELRYCPCGLCHPCRIKIESGMKQLLPEEAIERYQKMTEIENMDGPDAAKKYRMDIWTKKGRIFCSCLQTIRAV